MRRLAHFQEPDASLRPVLWAVVLVLAALLAGGCTSAAPTDSATGTPADGTVAPMPIVTESAVDAVENTPEPTIRSREDRLKLVTPEALPELVPPKDDNPVIGEVPQEILDAIVTELSETEGLRADGILVTRAESVVWPDGSLGCPKPDEMYTQAPVNGYWVVLKSDTKRFDYRANANGYFFSCEGPGKAPPASATPEM